MLLIAAQIREYLEQRVQHILCVLTEVDERVCGQRLEGEAKAGDISRIHDR